MTPKTVVEELIGDEGYCVDQNGIIYQNNGSGLVVKDLQVTRNGYLISSFKINGKRKYILAHRLIAISLIPNPLNLETVNHINGNKKDNSPSNLEWMTRSDNAKHAFSIGLSKRRYEGDPILKNFRDGQRKYATNRRIYTDDEVRYIVDNRDKKSWWRIWKDLGCKGYGSLIRQIYEGRCYKDVIKRLQESSLTLAYNKGKEETNGAFWRGMEAGIRRFSKSGLCGEPSPEKGLTIKQYIEKYVEPNKNSNNL